MNGDQVFVVGLGMTKFCKPQREFNPEADFPVFAKTAVERALQDSCLKYSDLEAAVVGCCFVPRGQRSLYPLGLTGIPIHNVSNACSTGSNALYLGRSLVAGRQHNCVLVLGLEKMEPGPLGSNQAKLASSKDGQSKEKPATPASSLDYHFECMNSKFPPDPKAPVNPQLFGNAAREHMKKYGSTQKQYAMIGEKNHRHSANNPYSQFRDVYTLQQIEESPMIYYPLTKLQCSPTSDGAAAAILCNKEFVIKHGLEGQAIQIIGQSMHTDFQESFQKNQDLTCVYSVGFEMAHRAAQDVYSQTGLTPQDFQVIELHDCFSANELLTYEALGLCEKGQGGRLIETGQTTYGGKWVVNPSGGLISKGHPLGATGVAQCCELNWQLRGEAGRRQVPNVKNCLQHNLGLGGAVVVTAYSRPKEWINHKPKHNGSLGDAPRIIQARL